jgi:hypothetical protein
MSVEVAQMDAVGRLGVATKRIALARETLNLIADIAEGSRTVNSLPNIAKIARGALKELEQ